ncbi:unnamed protein product [Acanthoscelides obtectus]|uniref:Uncharacterized protein n=1 Tax=Acanthoscelides obtectus TaxID=200917 RepID=A0A9P0LNW9_ACAOB|nr:unnamed protein product [Acanthoscelides obtectus]CAK1638713.1 hypothetical protein AOBTE_LOCUS10775 [Acanthoscelides obtectus]
MLSSYKGSRRGFLKRSFARKVMNKVHPSPHIIKSMEEISKKRHGLSGSVRCGAILMKLRMRTKGRMF